MQQNISNWKSLRLQAGLQMEKLVQFNLKIPVRMAHVHQGYVLWWNLSTIKVQLLNLTQGTGSGWFQNHLNVDLQWHQMSPKWLSMQPRPTELSVVTQMFLLSSIKPLSTWNVDRATEELNLKFYFIWIHLRLVMCDLWLLHWEHFLMGLLPCFHSYHRSSFKMCWQIRWFWEAVCVCLRAVSAASFANRHP